MHCSRQAQMPTHGFYTRDLAPLLVRGRGRIVPLADTVRAHAVLTACEIGELASGSECVELMLNLKTCEVRAVVAGALRVVQTHCIVAAEDLRLCASDVVQHVRARLVRGHSLLAAGCSCTPEQGVRRARQLGVKRHHHSTCSLAAPLAPHLTLLEVAHELQCTHSLAQIRVGASSLLQVLLWKAISDSMPNLALDE